MAVRERTLPLFGDAGEQRGEEPGRPAEGAFEKAAAPPPPPGAGLLVQAAWPLLATLARLTAGATVGSAERFMQAAIEHVRTFEQAALAGGVSPREVAAARYCLCSALDEAVLTTGWGQASGWNANTLLSRFHGETWGGEKVFGIIDRVLQAPQHYPDLIELLHRLMLLGFQGRYRVERDGTARADVVRGRLFQALRSRQDAAPAQISARPVQTRRVRGPIGFVPVWIVALACLLIAFCGFGYLRYKLQDDALLVADRISALTQPGGVQ